MFKIILAFSTILLFIISPVLANLSENNSRDYYEGCNYGYNKGESDGILPLETHGANKDLTEGMHDGYWDAQEKKNQEEWEEWEEETRREQEEFYNEFDKSMEELDRELDPPNYNPEPPRINANNPKYMSGADLLNNTRPPEEYKYKPKNTFNWAPIIFGSGVVIGGAIIFLITRRR